MRSKLVLIVLGLILTAVFAPRVHALPSSGHMFFSDPTGDIYTEQCTDDGYMDMRDLTGLTIDWDTTVLSITISVKELTNTTAAWNNTGYTITISYAEGGQEWWPQWSSTHFNATTTPEALWEFCVLVQNITSEGGLGYCYILDTGWTYVPFEFLGVTVEFTGANDITVRVPWDAIGGFESYGDEFYVTAGSFYCYAYGAETSGDKLTKFIDHVGTSNQKMVIIHEDWGSDAEGYPKYEVIIEDYCLIPEFSVLPILLVMLVISVIAAKKLKK